MNKMLGTARDKADAANTFKKGNECSQMRYSKNINY